MRKIFYYGNHYIDKNDIKSVTNILKNKKITQGAKVIEFENKLKKYFGSKYCAAVSSGTSALFLLAKALNWKKNDIIITTPNTFLATANCVLSVGAKLEFVDIDENTGCIDPFLVEKKILLLKKKKQKVKGVIAVDFSGIPCDWKSLYKLKKKYKFQLINDNCHALGSKYFNNRKYAIKYADHVTQSFHAVKNITTGEGGALHTKDKSIIEKIYSLRNHGLVKNNKSKNFLWNYNMVFLSGNHRITDIQCALGISQLSKLDKFVKRRNQIAKEYDLKFQNIKKIKIYQQQKNFQSAYHLYFIRINFSKIKTNKKKFCKNLKKRGIILQSHYMPIYKHSYYQKYFKFKSLKKSESFYNNMLSIPIYYSLNNTQINYIASSIKKCLV